MFKKLLITSFIAVGISTTASAGIQGSALLSLSNIKVVDASDDSVITGSFDQSTTSADAGGDFVKISSALTNSLSEVRRGATTVDTSQTTLSIIGVTGGSVVTVVGDGSPAYVGTNGSPTDDDFTIDVTDDYIRADTVFGGSFVDLVEASIGGSGGAVPVLPAPATGGFGTTYADMNIAALEPLNNSGDANIVNNSSQIRFQASSDLTVRLDFDATSAMFLAHVGTPNLGGVASTALQITINEVFSGGSNGLTPSFSELNQKISLSPLNAGPASYSITDSFSTEEFELRTGSTYEITINQSAFIQAVPEPSSLSVLGVLCLVGGFGRRRRK